MPVSVLSLALAATLAAASPPPEPVDAAPAILKDGKTFRDLDRNGRLDPYEDHRLDADRRVADLLSRMTLEEKAGAVMHGTAPTPQSVRGGVGAAETYDVARFETLNRQRHISSVITRLSAAPNVLAAQNNALQSVASGSRLAGRPNRRESLENPHLVEGVMTRDEDFEPTPGRIRDRGVSRLPTALNQIKAATQRAGGRGSGSGRAPGAGPSTFGRGRSAALLARHVAARRTVVIKARVVRQAAGRATLGAHLRYLVRDGTTRDGAAGQLFDAEADGVDRILVV